jgi:CRP/FNR family transcriptional regulator, cyclic AMP receptor protein
MLQSEDGEPSACVRGAGGYSHKPSALQPASDTQKIVRALQRLSPFLGGVAEPDLLSLLPRLIETSLLRGDRLFADGDPGDRLYLVIRGRIKTYATSRDGRVVILDVVGPGDLLGESVLFGPVRTESAEAIAHSTVLGISSKDVSGLLSSSPCVALLFAQVIWTRLTRARCQITNLVGERVSTRLAMFLLATTRTDSGGEELVGAGLTHLEIAQSIGTNRETVTALFSRFRRMGMIEIRGKDWVVRDSGRLAACAEGAILVGTRPGPERALVTSQSFRHTPKPGPLQTYREEMTA